MAELHRLTFLDAGTIPKFDQGYWWLAFHDAEAVAFAGVVPSTHVCNAGYFCPVGVLSEHWGNRLQLRLMRALEAGARLNGWCSIVSDTTDNLSSANNFIRAGYRLFEPSFPGPGRIRFIGGRSSNREGPFLRPPKLQHLARWPPGCRALFAFGVSWRECCGVAMLVARLDHW